MTVRAIPTQPALLTLIAGIALFTTRPAPADPLALWNIVHGECVVHQEAGEGPQPCESVHLSQGQAEGVAILKHRRGLAQLLAIPPRHLSRTQAPQILAPTPPSALPP